MDSWNFDRSSDGAPSPSRGPHSLWGVIVLVLTVFVVLPFCFIVLVNIGSSTGITVFDRFNNWFMTPAAVRPDTGRTISDAHLNVQEVRESLRRLDEEGKALFGVWHSWQIPDYKSGMSGMDILEKSKEPHHPDFVAAFARRQRIDNEEQADDVLDKYFYIRVFYSEANAQLTELSIKLKTTVHNLPPNASLDFKLGANEMLQDSFFAKKDAEQPLILLNEVIKPYFKSSK